MKSSKWAVRVARASAEGLLRLRQHSEIVVGEEGEFVWAHGVAGSNEAREMLPLLLRSIPGADRYEVIEDNQLVPAGRRVPAGRLPALAWQSLETWVNLQLPPTVWVGHAKQVTSLKMVRGCSRWTDPAKPASIMLCGFSDWLDWVESASVIRLSRLRFACPDDSRGIENQVFVWGEPLPPLPGQRFVVYQNVALPIGWSWSPDVSVACLNEVFDAPRNGIAIWQDDSTWHVLLDEQLVAVTRSAVRLSARSVL